MVACNGLPNDGKHLPRIGVAKWHWWTDLRINVTFRSAVTTPNFDNEKIGQILVKIFHSVFGFANEAKTLPKTCSTPISQRQATSRVNMSDLLVKKNEK